MDAHEIDRAKAFSRQLAVSGVEKRVFAVLEQDEDRLCLTNDGKRWEVFYLEHGHKHYLEAFDRVDAALEYFLRRLREIYPKARALFFGEFERKQAG